MAARVYATRAELIAYAPASVTVPTDPEAARLLARASERMDEAAARALYEVDDAGLPTDATIKAALRDATCAQAIYWLASGGDDAEASSALQQVAAGRISFSRRQDAPKYAPQAVTHLRLARLYPGPIIDGAL